MKNLNVTFEDAEFLALSEAKGDKVNWHDFIMGLIEQYPQQKTATKSGGGKERAQKR